MAVEVKTHALGAQIGVKDIIFIDVEEGRAAGE